MKPVYLNSILGGITLVFLVGIVYFFVQGPEKEVRLGNATMESAVPSNSPTDVSGIGIKLVPSAGNDGKKMDGAELPVVSGSALGIVDTPKRDGEPLNNEGSTPGTSPVSDAPSTPDTSPIPKPIPLETSINPLGLKKNLCIHTLCIDIKEPYAVNGEDVVQISYTQEDETDEKVSKKEFSNGILLYQREEESYGTKEEWDANTTEVIIKKDGSSGKSIHHPMMAKEETFAQKTGNTDKPFFVMETSGSCGGESIYQYMVDTKGKKHIPEGFTGYPTSLKIGNISYQNYWPEEALNFISHHIEPTGSSAQKIDTILSVNDNISEKLTEIVVESKNFTQQYAVTFKEFPNQAFFYKSTQKNAETISNIENPAKILDKKGNIIDLETTRNILKIYDGNYSEGIEKDNSITYNPRQLRKKDSLESDYPTIQSLSQDMLPLFRATQLDENGNYLVYTSGGYESVMFAELCKPVVYVYDQKKRENTLQVNLSPGSEFTKLIPEFTTGNEWKFQADTTSNISVKGDNGSFSYLYYSAKIPNYTFNTDGWHIQGKDVVNFLNEKLDIIGFNAVEKEDFISYWKTEFNSNQFYMISFKFNDSLDSYVGLKFQNSPETLFRVLLEAHPISKAKPEYLWPKVGTRFDKLLLKTYNRSGTFDVFEWGGTVQKVPNGPVNVR